MSDDDTLTEIGIKKIQCQECGRFIRHDEPKIIIADLTYCNGCYTIESRGPITRPNDMNN